MKFELPSLLEPIRLADLCREAAAREGVEPDLVEKDFYLTRLLWSFGAVVADQVLLKGGTLFSKVDIGFFRMSEDADFVLPVTPSPNRGRNVSQLNRIREALKTIAPNAGLTVRFPGGDIRDGGRYCGWDLDYVSDFGPQSIRLEVSLHEVLRPSRKVALRQLLVDPLIGSYEGAYCWALHEDEARAEKVRAACTREAIRDFYDLERIAELDADLSSTEFLALVDAKLEELHAPPFRNHRSVFALTEARRRKLRRSLDVELPRVLRRDAPPFDLDQMIDRFRSLWS